MQLKEIKEITGTIILKSGLHIGAGDMEMRIGGTDNPVVKHPHTQEPYIPGSSIKGKIRSMLELRSGLMGETKGEPLSIKTLKKLREDKTGKSQQIAECKKILKLFGAGAGDADEEIANELGPTRVSFADCTLNPDWLKKASDQMIPLIEVKSENQINRIKGTALNPRFTERVPAETKFDFCITLKVLGDEKELETLLLEGMRLLEMDALGGNGSRGYGRICFEFESKELADKFDAVKPLENATTPRKKCRELEEMP